MSQSVSWQAWLLWPCPGSKTQDQNLPHGSWFHLFLRFWSHWLNITLYFKANFIWNIDDEEVSFLLEIGALCETYLCTRKCVTLCLPECGRFKDATLFLSSLRRFYDCFNQYTMAEVILWQFLGQLVREVAASTSCLFRLQGERSKWIQINPAFQPSMLRCWAKHH